MQMLRVAVLLEEPQMEMLRLVSLLEELRKDSERESRSGRRGWSEELGLVARRGSLQERMLPRARARQTGWMLARLSAAGRMRWWLEQWW
jgi:hypothetical protein